MAYIGYYKLAISVEELVVLVVGGNEYIGDLFNCFLQ